VKAAGFIILTVSFMPPVFALQAQNDAVTTDNNTSQFQSAYRLAYLQQGGNKMSTALQKNLRKQFSAALETDVDIASLEVEYPGVTNAMVDAILPVAIRQAEDTMPDLLARIAKLYAANLTEGEINEVTAFVDTTSFQRLRTNLEKNLDMSDALAEGLEADVTAEDLNAMVFASAKKTVPDLSLADQLSLADMAVNPSFKKFTKLTPQRQKIEADWNNKSTPEEEAELEAVVTAAMEKFTGLDLEE